MLAGIRFATVAGALMVGAPAAAAPAAPDSCTALNYILAQARTEFPALGETKFDAASCSLKRQEFKCEWGFPVDTFAAAEEQASRLVQCTARQPSARPLGKKRGELGFQVNPETSAFIRGPEMRSGRWTLGLRIVSTADWN